MLVKTEQQCISSELLKDMLNKPKINVIIVGPLSCLRTQYFRGREAGLLERIYFYEINELSFITNSHVEGILYLSEKILSEKDGIEGLIIYTACADVISATNYKKLINGIKDKYNCPVIILPRGPLAKRIKGTRERMVIALDEIEKFNFLKSEGKND